MTNTAPSLSDQKSPTQAASAYRGRFAPSPSGPLHHGSMIAAIASYLDAKHNHGKWLLRIEDVDTTRTQANADQAILSLLERFHLYWDESVLYQSQRTEYYSAIISQLGTACYPCSCTRKQLIKQQLSRKKSGIIYPGFCRDNPMEKRERYSYRLKTNNQPITFQDHIQKPLFKQHLQRDIGDFIIKRTDGIFAYQLAVVADDEAQAITHIVRGSDLLDNTPRQLYLQQILGFKEPKYAHFPTATYENGQKLSKQTGAVAVSTENPLDVSIKALQFLGQQPPDSKEFDSMDDLWHWAITHWSLGQVPKQMHIKI